MSSTHVVPIVEITNIKPHPNADKLEIAEVEGWQTLVGKGQQSVGDKMVFIPVDSVVPEIWADKWGVREYLAGATHSRVKCVKLRGEPSYGFLVELPEELADKKVGTDVMDFFGITKYEPPVRGGGGAYQRKPRVHHPLFDKYTNIENLRNNMRTFTEGEPVVVTEKIHGANVRVGLVDTVIKRKDVWSRVLRLFGKNRTEVIEEYVAGSHNVQRKIDWDNLEGSPYTYPLSLKGVIDFTKWLKHYFYVTIQDINFQLEPQKPKQVLVYGEIYGPGIQKLTYGIEEGKYGFAIIGIKVDGKHLDWEDVNKIGVIYGVPTVPVIEECTEFNFEQIKELAEGMSRVEGADNIIEGFVIIPKHETANPRGNRKILKYKGATYLEWKDKGKNRDYTEE